MVDSANLGHLAKQNLLENLREPLLLQRIDVTLLEIVSKLQR